MRRSLSIGGSSSLQWRKVGRSWRLRMCFRLLLSVRIEIDQLQCVNCWVIIHCLLVSCMKINHSRCALVIWSSLQLTSKQWIITQQFTAGADLFLKLHSYLEACLFSSKIICIFLLLATFCNKAFIVVLSSILITRMDYSNCLKFQTLYSFCFQIKCCFSGLQLQNTCQNRKQGWLCSDYFFRCGLIWIFAVCLGHGFRNLEHFFSYLQINHEILITRID